MNSRKKKLLWLDAEANCHRLSTRADVALVLDKAKGAGIDVVMVDVKPLGGEVLYLSEYAPRLGEVNGFAYPKSFDLLAAAIEERRSRGIQVHAGMNVFSEGHREWGRGPAYQHPEWQVISYEADGFKRSEESGTFSFGIFINPIGPAREYELKIVREIVSKYEIDGITFDRMRYPNLYADFSQTSREAFEAWLGQGPVTWPDDIFLIGEPSPKHGRYYKQWLEWRAWQIKGFAQEAIGLIRSIKPDLIVGNYVGSWYEPYFDVGVNWASEKFHAGYDWMTPQYNQTGFAELFDYLCTGCYYRTPTIAEARTAGRSEGATVEAAARLSCRVVNEACPVYASLYLKDYAGKPEDFRRAIQAALGNSQGVMLFDLIYLEQYDWWRLIEEEFRS